MTFPSHSHIVSTPKRIVVLHELLSSVGIRHQFGGAIALAWYRTPRATTNVDVNLTIPPSAAETILNLLFTVGVSVTAADRSAIAKDGQASLEWHDSALHVFFATTELHQEMARLAREVRFGPATIPILAPEHLIVCKAIYNRPKDWLDIEEMFALGTEVDGGAVLRWIDDILGPFSAQSALLQELLGRAGASPPQLGD